MILKRGGWRYDSESGELSRLTGSRKINMHEFKTSASVLDYIVQMSQKSYKDEEIGALVRLIDQVLELQRYYCSGAMHTEDLGKIVRDGSAVASEVASRRMSR